MDREQHAGLLAKLLTGDPSASPAAVREAAERLLVENDCPRPSPGADEEDPRAGLHWLLTMAWRTHRRLRDPLPSDPARAAALAYTLQTRPLRDDAHGQLFIDAPSLMRRAAAVMAFGTPALAVGDDDALTLALHQAGADDLAAIDIDERVLGYLEEASVGAIETHRIDVTRDPVPEVLRGRFATVVTDPFRDLDGGLSFLTWAAACLRPDGHLIWVDHPDWSYEQPEVLAAMESLGFELVAMREDVHAYPLTIALIRPDEVADALELDRGWLRAITELTHAWSSIYVLERRPPDPMTVN